MPKAAAALDMSGACVPEADPRILASLSAGAASAEAQFFPAFYKSTTLAMSVDSNHSEKRVPLFFWSDRHVDYMIEGGIRHVFLELPDSDQSFIDTLAGMPANMRDALMPMFSAMFTYSNAFLSPADNHEVTRLRALAIRRLIDAGVKVHCIDTHSQIDGDAMKTYFDYMRQMVTRFLQDCGKKTLTSEAVMEFRAFVAKDPAYQAAKEIVMQNREDDGERYNRVMALSNGEPSVIHFGYGHFGSERSFQHYAARDGIPHARVDIYGEINYYAETLREEMARGLGYDHYLPAFIHTVDSGNVYNVAGPAQPMPGVTARPPAP